MKEIILYCFKLLLLYIKQFGRLKYINQNARLVKVISRGISLHVLDVFFYRNYIMAV